MAGSVLLTRAGRALATVVVAGGIVGATVASGAAPAAALNACSPGVKCPKAIDDTYQANLGGPLNVPAPGLLANDQGPAGTIVDVADSDTTSWFGADVSVHADGSFTYTPDPRDPSAGADTFDYYIEDAAGNWDIATATVNIAATIRDDQYTTNPGRTLLVKAPGVLGNDLGYDAGNLSGDDTSANGGAVTLNSDGSFAYVPPAGFHGTDTFTYTVDDTDDDNTYTATVHIDVSGPAAPATTAPGNPGPGKSTPATGPGASSGSGGRQPGGTSGSGATTPGATNKPVPTGKGGKLGKPADSSTKGAPADGKAAAAGTHASGASASGPVAVVPGAHHKSSSNTALVVVIVLVVAAAALGGGWYLWRRRVLAQKPPPVA